MDYRILGPLEVCQDGKTVPLAGDKQRALLAILLLHAGEVVSGDRLIDDLWGERSPPGAVKALHAHVARLRKVLETHDDSLLAGDGDGSRSSPGAVLLTRGHGYLIRVEPGELDLDRFRGLVEEGRERLANGDPEQAAEALRAGLALWRGAPLADVSYEAFAQAPIAQLEELRVSAVEDRVEADLVLGRHDQLVGELTALVAENPLRERLRGQLMLALYRCGRQAEALDVYQKFRRGLAGELGLDPGPGLQQLELAILGRDPSLERQSGNGAPTGVTEARPLPSRETVDRRGRRLAAGGLALVALILAGAVVASSLGGPSPRSAIAADSVGAISPSGEAIRADVPIGASPSAMTAGAGAVWVSNYDDNTVSRIDPSTHTVQTIQAGSTPSGIAVGAGDVWVANNLVGTVSRIDPKVDRVVQPIPVGNGPSGVAVRDGSVWVANSSDGTLSRIDAATGAVVKTISLGGGATDVAVGLGAVWVSDGANGRVLRVDPQTDQVTEAINVGTGPGAITTGYGSVWVANSLDGTVSRIDPQTNQVAATIPVGDGPSATAVGAGGVWVADEFGSSVARVDPATETVGRTIAVGNRPRGVAVAGGEVWVGAQASGAGHRGGTLTVMSERGFGSLDADSPNAMLPSSFALSMTNDSLTAFKHVGASDAAQLVPDLATSRPVPTDGGTTYTFQLRRGIRYSTGEPLRAEDVRRGFEHMFAIARGVNSPGYTFEGVVGGGGCVAHPARCDLSRGIVTDDGADTVTFHLVGPDPEFLDKLATTAVAPLPAGTPKRDLGPRPLPATGPYDIASYTPHAVVLARNPYFREWSHAAQPDGYPDRIVWRIGATPEAAVTAVERGTADWSFDNPPADRLSELQARFASQLHIEPNDVTVGWTLNTQVAPFTDIRVRRALNYAVDRAKIASILGQASQPTCQLLPPYVPGYQRYCPYTLDPDVTGAWHAADLAKAEALVAASGTRGEQITVWSTGVPPLITDAGGAAISRYLVSLLDRLGYNARLKTLSTAAAASFDFLDSRRKIQDSLGFDFPAYPAASQLLGPPYTSCQSFISDSLNNSNAPELCDPRLDAIVNSALAAESAGSPTATPLWTKADQEYTNQAPVVQLANPGNIDLVSHRVGNYQYDPAQLAVLLDQLWVR